VDDIGRLLDEIALPVVDDQAMVGFALGVVRGGELVASRCYGYADLGSGRPVDTSTVFRIGSISKTFTGVAAMQLVERGLIALDDPVADHLRTFRWVQPPGTRPATVREVMTHTSGVGEVQRRRDLLLDSATVGLGVPWGEPVPPLAEYYRGEIHSDIAPGRRWSYANHAITALGQVVEDVSGMPFEQYAREHVFAPLGLTGTDFVLQDGQRRSLALGYEVKGARVRDVPWSEVVVRAAGSVFSSVDQMATYAAALLNGGANEHGRVLKPTSLQTMFTAHWRQHPALPGQGLTFLLDDYDGHPVVWHDGGWPAFVSSMLIAPGADTAVLAFTNSGSRAVHAVAEQVLRRLLGVPVLSTGEARRRAPSSPELWADLVGVYAPPRGGTTNARLLDLGLELEVLVRDGHLVLRSPLGSLRAGVRLYPSDPDDPLLFESVVAFGGAPCLLRAAFVRGADGRATELVGTMLLPYQVERRPALRSARRLGRLAAGAGVLVTGAALLRHHRRNDRSGR
jgi:CubicO group peptidase (beta-lactamase class C family)